MGKGKIIALVLVLLVLVGAGYMAVLARTDWLTREDVPDWKQPDTTPPIIRAYYYDRITDDYAYLRALVECGVDVDERDEHGLTLLMTMMHLHDPYELHSTVVDFLLDNGADPQAESGGSTVLHMAATGNRPEYIGTLVEHGAEVNARNDNGETPLISFVRCYFAPVSDGDPQHGGVPSYYDGRPAVAVELIAAGADISLRNGKGKTAYDYVKHLINLDDWQFLNPAEQK